MSRRAKVEVFEWVMGLSVNSDRRFELIHGQIVEAHTAYRRGLIIVNGAFRT